MIDAPRLGPRRADDERPAGIATHRLGPEPEGDPSPDHLLDAGQRAHAVVAQRDDVRTDPDRRRAIDAFTTVAATMFIGGVPMNWATNRSTGWS